MTQRDTVVFKHGTWHWTSTTMQGPRLLSLFTENLIVDNNVVQKEQRMFVMHAAV